MRIAIFDHAVTPTNPSGGYHFRLLRGLCRKHDFTVFSIRFENPCPDRIRWVHVPVPMRPAPLLLLAFWIVAPIRYCWFVLTSGIRFDLLQVAEGNVLFGDVCCAHFCFRGYLRNEWKRSRPRGLRRATYWLAYHLRALAEPAVLRRAKNIVVPSSGLRRELETTYPPEVGKFRVIPSSVDTQRMRRPESFARQEMRLALRLNEDDVALIFVALGAYERKGLPLLLDALASHPNKQLKLLVVGGAPDLVSNYRLRTSRMGLGDRVQFLGMQSDVRPYLWAADAFVFPSHYETFALVAFEAAAAGLPLLVPPLSGVEDFFRDGKNGILIEPSVNAIANALGQFVGLSWEERHRMGERAQQDVALYDTANFVGAWGQFYREVKRDRGCAHELSRRDSADAAVAGRKE